MSETVTLTASDGHKLQAYRAGPSGKPKAALVIIQEIFGVNSHMRGVADGFARDGYATITPALFDRVKPGIELGYAEADIAAGREIRGKLSWDQVLADVAAAKAAVAGQGKIGIIGYCFGGSVAWLGATRGGFDAAVGYYGGQVSQFAEEKPACPVQLHFGETDHGIPLTDVDKVRKAQPQVEINLYPAGHGFNCEQRGSYHAESAKIARDRTVAFLAKHLA